MPVPDLLQLKGLEVHFPMRGAIFNRMRGRPAGVIRAVDGVDLAIGAREIVALVGESGSGKTTTGRAIVKLQQPTAGKIVLDGRDMTDIRSSGALRSFRRRAQMIFQDPYQALNPRQTLLPPIPARAIWRPAAARRDRRSVGRSTRVDRRRRARVDA